MRHQPPRSANGAPSSPTPASPPPSSTGSPSTPTSSRPAPSPTGSAPAKPPAAAGSPANLPGHPAGAEIRADSGAKELDDTQVGIELAEVLAAVQALGASKPAVTITGKGSLTISSPVIGGTGRVVALADAGAGTDSLAVVRHADVEKLTDRASRGELPARLTLISGSWCR